MWINYYYILSKTALLVTSNHRLKAEQTCNNLKVKNRWWKLIIYEGLIYDYIYLHYLLLHILKEAKFIWYGQEQNKSKSKSGAPSHPLSSFFFFCYIGTFHRIVSIQDQHSQDVKNIQESNMSKTSISSISRGVCGCGDCSYIVKMAGGVREGFNNKQKTFIFMEFSIIFLTPPLIYGRRKKHLFPSQTGGH